MSTFNEWKENSKRLEELPELIRQEIEDVSYQQERLRYIRNLNIYNKSFSSKNLYRLFN